MNALIPTLSFQEQRVFYFLRPYIQRYPYTERWYLKKVLPGKRRGERCVFARYVENELVAVGIAKSTRDEKKISLFYVDPLHRDTELDYNLMDRMLVWLETFRPVVRMTDLELNYLTPYSEGLDWRLTSVKCFSENPESCEYLYNEPTGLNTPSISEKELSQEDI